MSNNESETMNRQDKSTIEKQKKSEKYLNSTMEITKKGCKNESR